MDPTIVANRSRQKCPMCYRPIIDVKSGYIVDDTVTTAVACDNTCERCLRISDYRVDRKIEFLRKRTVVTEIETHSFSYGGLPCYLSSRTVSKRFNRQSSGIWDAYCIAPLDAACPNDHYFHNRIQTLSKMIYSNTYDSECDNDAFVNENGGLGKLAGTYKSKHYALKHILDLVDNIVSSH